LPTPVLFRLYETVT